MNFNFGTPKTSAVAGSTPTSNFGTADNKAAQNVQTPAKAPAFGQTFATPTTNVTPGFNINPTASAAPTLSFGTPNTSAPAFPLGTPTSAATASKQPGFNLAGTPATTNLPTMGLGATTASGLVPNLTLGTAATSAAPTSGFSLGATPTTSGISFGGLSSAGATTTTTASTGFTLGKIGATSTPANLLGTTATIPAPTLGTTTTITAAAPPGSLNFNQIEEMLNKWTLELEEQGKVFINQALQLNAWDRLVIANGEKILTLNNGIEKVKQQQQQLDHELEFVLIQQRELEECIAPLEKELKDIPIADHDRNHTYQMAENMDTQLKQMSEDLKEIIEHLNESNKKEDNNDPVSQIGRILNAHMNSLQWIDRNTAQISTLLDQITKMHDMHRRDNERSFHLTYE